MRGAPGAEWLLGLFVCAGAGVGAGVGAGAGAGVAMALGWTLRKRNDVPIAVVSGFLFILP
ncbi:hypothetical protein BK146_31270 [Paenibacillus sp. FSL R7-0333]|nr:hypothetical protein BK146_31270 [Paenibacillus sp. FSL R7-0333]